MVNFFVHKHKIFLITKLLDIIIVFMIIKGWKVHDREH